MESVLRNPIRKLPTAVAGESAEVSVRRMKWQHAVFWHRQVQPLIDLNYVHAGRGAPDENIRADVGWNWLHNYMISIGHSLASKPPGSRSGPAQAFVIAVSAEDNRDVPLGMLISVPRFFCRVGGVSEQRTFAWYLSNAPGEFYDQPGIKELRKMAQALLDTAIQSGLDAGADGQLLLHADPRGGEKLARFYEHRCKMSRLAAESTPVSVGRRGQDPREFFYFSAADAGRFIAQLDPYRS